ncbi:MAG: ChbG/HpnK family deacetylase [Gammaproteobacteria bacterium]|nr:ChbG/HpnK family deacetylase [Gammaproteobacteria bacterium]
MKKRIVLCADDYGQAPSISQGIIQLLQKNRLSAASCMVNTAYWAEHASWLRPFINQVDIGLHVNLTEGQALSSAWIECYGKNLLPLRHLLGRAVFHRLDKAVIAAECHAQIDHFVERLGILPTFMDGHQHAHQFPVIRQAFIQVYEERLKPKSAYVRLAKESIKLSDKDKVKKAIICATGARAFQRLLNQHNITYNHSFAGIYAFSSNENYRELFSLFLQKINDCGLIMCHPGLAAASISSPDPIAKTRWQEYQYFASDAFLQDCVANNVVISRFSIV